MGAGAISIALSKTLKESLPESSLSAARVIWYQGFDELLNAAANADAAWVRPTDLTPDQWSRLVAHAREMRWLHFSRVGVDALPLDDIARRGILLTNGRGLSARPMAEHVVMSMLAIRRGLPNLLRAQSERIWEPGQARADLLASTTALVLGYGHVGQAVAHRLRAFDVKVYASRRHAGAASDGVLSGSEWFEVLPTIDWLILCLPLTALTRRLIGEGELTRMKSTAVLVNVARGEIVDEAALIRALRSGTIGGAILDTFAQEPLPKDSALWELPNAIITPHVAWRSSSFVREETSLFLENFGRFSNGESLRNIVDPGTGY